MGDSAALIGRALRWTWGVNTLSALVQLALACLTVRFLAPVDYGLMAAAAAAVRFALYLADLGISSAIVQKPDLDLERDVPVLFRASVAAGGVTTLAVWLLAPWLAEWSAHPDATTLIRLYGLTALFSGAGLTGLALARRRLDFRAVSLWGLAATLTGQGLVTLPLAIAGFGVWSLMVGALVQAAVTATLALRSGGVRWRVVGSSRARGIELAALSSRFLTLRLLDSAGLHLLPLAVFALCGADQAGMWDRAFALTILPLEMVTVGLGQVLFPLFSRLGDDPETRRRTWLTGMALTVSLTAAIAAGMATAAIPLVAVALGGGWADSAEPFFWLAVWSAARCLTGVSGTLLEGAGRLRARAAIQTAYLLMTAALLLGLTPDRASGVAQCLVAVELAALLFLLPAAARTCGATAVAVAAHLAAALFPVGPVVAAALVGLSLTNTPLLSVALVVPLCAIALAVSLLFNPYRPLRRSVIGVIRPALTGRRSVATVMSGPPPPVQPSALPTALPSPGAARVDVLGVGVDPLTLDLAVKAVTGWIDAGQPANVCLATVHGVVESRWDAGLKAAYADAALVATDGMPLVWWCRALGWSAERVYGPDLMLAVCATSVERGWRHFLLGATDETLAALSRTLRQRYPGLRIVGTLAPPFRATSAAEDAAMIDAVNEAQPDILWIGLGAPKQEKWMAAHRQRLTAPVALGVGAAFDFHAGVKRQAPLWMRRNGLEWLFRLCSEPQRLARRYAVGNSIFIALTVSRILKGLFRPGRR
jgi:N-acetylglucosaminyldiphosphoundecaprenol N-acetyl-beta-D-mannosaminyltransferase